MRRCILTFWPETTAKLEIGLKLREADRQISTQKSDFGDFREKSHKLIPELTNVKTPLAKTTVKMKTGERQIARFPRRSPDFEKNAKKVDFPEKGQKSGGKPFFPKKAVFPENAVFPEKCRFSGFLAKSPIFCDFAKARGPKVEIALERRLLFAEIGALRGTRAYPFPLGNSQVSPTVRIAAANILFATAGGDLISPTRHIRLFLFDNLKTKGL